MAGAAQGGGGRPAVGGNLPQYQNMLQNYRQGMAGAPSQVPGTNMAAPGGPGGPQQYQPAPFNPGMGNMIGGGPAQGVPGGPGGPQQYQPAPFNPGMGGGPQIQPPQGMGNMVGDMMYRPPGGMPAPQPSQQLNPFANPSQQPQPMPRPMPRPMPMPQVKGNPNAMPLQRPQRGNPMASVTMPGRRG